MISGKKQKPKVIAVTIRKRARPRHHGGAWKIAYADFVTAMMAFFLLMWVAVTLNKSQIKGIADYFKTPLTVRMLGGRGHGDHDAAIRGSGSDITRTEGQVSSGLSPRPSPKAGGKGAHASGVKLAELKGKLKASIAKNNMLSQFKPQITVTQSNEGLLLQITDSGQQPLFANGSTRLTPAAQAMLQALGHVLNLAPNGISIAGHTDAQPYAGPKQGYSNWELSLDRANACRRALVAGGFDAHHVLRVVGLGSAVPLIPAHPKDPLNRRISISVLSRSAMRQLTTTETGGVRVAQDSQASASP